MSKMNTELPEFVSIYVDRLTENLKEHANPDIKLLPINICDSYELKQELSQEITGVPNAYSAINGDQDILARFAEDYARVGIDSFDDLCKEALLDFLNLINGLFAVYLSNNNISELSLNAPVKDGSHTSLDSKKNGNIYAMPVEFPYGVVTFILA